MTNTKEKLSGAERAILYHAGISMRKRKVASFHSMVRPYQGCTEEVFDDLMPALIQYGHEVRSTQKMSVTTACALNWLGSIMPVIVRSIQNGSNTDVLKRWAEIVVMVVSSIYRQHGGHAFAYVEYVVQTGRIPRANKQLIHMEVRRLRRFKSVDYVELVEDFDRVFE
jgi:hypothetical protein